MDDDRARQRGSLTWAGVTAAATAVLYFALLGWHAQKDYSPANDPKCTGPYEAWQVIGFALGLAAVVATVALRGHPRIAVVACVMPLTLLWSADAATIEDPCMSGADLWPVGALLLLGGSTVGFLLLVVVVMAIKRRF